MESLGRKWLVGKLFFVRARHRKIVMCWNIRGMIAFIFLLIAQAGGAQDLGNHFVKIADGVYIYARDAASNCGIIVTQEGVVLIDSGPNPPDSLLILKAIKQLTPLPIRFLINTETHNDHTTGNFVFSPPAVVIAA